MNYGKEAAEKGQVCVGCFGYWCAKATYVHKVLKKHHFGNFFSLLWQNTCLNNLGKSLFCPIV